MQRQSRNQAADSQHMYYRTVIPDTATTLGKSLDGVHRVVYNCPYGVPLCLLTDPTKGAEVMDRIYGPRPERPSLTPNGVLNYNLYISWPGLWAGGYTYQFFGCEIKFAFEVPASGPPDVLKDWEKSDVAALASSSTAPFFSLAMQPSSSSLTKQIPPSYYRSQKWARAALAAVTLVSLATRMTVNRS
ncbi:uncharacterized protein BXZ73DRAFT_106362 [Epithele typhae]|uniref:uncharacterized protein n=1 Tax=Epithele typhae TaxID=378194 RepID=UPI002007AC65|nr:uncharacterized protein BXZ73DRAFT_106362 [Epithele typhae]KAH9915054.1 hypothetical protein BXZ73DRAFT_106362 [Epithele typhae]